jgi:hypothetical protein
MEAQVLQAPERCVVADLGGQAHEGRRDRVGGILLVGPPVTLAQHADALVLLGEVHEVEVHREGRATSSAREIENDSAIDAARSNASADSSV